jgi:signal transduction histidine kinase
MESKGEIRIDHSDRRRRVERIVETLATLGSQAEGLAAVAHDARNMVAALGLYCDLLEEPGVLAPPFAHYGQELRLVAAASRRLVEKLVVLDAHPADTTAKLFDRPTEGHRSPGCGPIGSGSEAAFAARDAQFAHRTESPAWRSDLLPAMPVANLAAELLANRNLLSALAGPAIILTVEATGGAQPVRLTAEDLTRVLVNLVKNAAEAMPEGGRIAIRLAERPAGKGASASVVLSVTDNGPGISSEALETIFTCGYTTRNNQTGGETWPLRHRGLGLAITRSIIEAAGGRIRARNQEQGGAQFEVELPVSRAGFQPTTISYQS